MLVQQLHEALDGISAAAEPLVGAAWREVPAFTLLFGAIFLASLPFWRYVVGLDRAKSAVLASCCMSSVHSLLSALGGWAGGVAGAERPLVERDISASYGTLALGASAQCCWSLSSVMQGLAQRRPHYCWARPGGRAVHAPCMPLQSVYRLVPAWQLEGAGAHSWRVASCRHGPPPRVAAGGYEQLKQWEGFQLDMPNTLPQVHGAAAWAAAKRERTAGMAWGAHRLCALPRAVRLAHRRPPILALARRNTLPPLSGPATL